MVKTALFLIITFCCINIYGQNRSIGILAAPAYYNIRSIKKSSARTYSNENGFTVGVDGHYYFNNSKLSVGVLLNTLTFESNFEPITSSNVLDPNVPLFTSFQNSYLKIPIYYSVSILSSTKFILSGSIGLSNSVLLTSNETTIYEDLSKRPSSFSKSYVFGGLCALNINFNMFDNLLFKINVVAERGFRGYDPFMAFPTELRPYLGFEYLF